ncbi:AlpA family transcriptional regulator [Duganella sp. BJB475]|jgi:prophage regulatory protein|uniref:helix-turn-helix transcriptional regulator n=1 Tax=Duganella sp. BJB475 TaxID=2233914 RepID=UPI000E343A9E|nr:AlpA family transcriptional regulator [Duganella sp. BJB475]RFP11866.1 AlpA family transcriptional regulator [Duganella sp. BJB475]
MRTYDSLPETIRLIRLKEVLRICGMSRSTLYNNIKERQFPEPIRISARSVAWLQSEVQEWVELKVKLRAVKHRQSAQLP